MPTFYTNAEITSIPSNPLYAALSAPVVTFSSTSDKTQEQIGKAEKHMDDLELDIDFLNEKRKQQEEVIKELITKLAETDASIKSLTDTVNSLNSYTNWLETRIVRLEERNDKMS